MGHRRQEGLPGRRLLGLARPEQPTHLCLAGISIYRVIQQVGDLGLVDLDLASSLGWWAATVVAYCLSGMVEHPKPKSPQPRYATR